MQISKDQEAHALELHERALVVDFHCDAVLATLPDSAYVIEAGAKRTLHERSSRGYVDIPRLVEGGVDCQVFSHFVEPIWRPREAHAKVVVRWSYVKRKHLTARKQRLHDEYVATAFLVEVE